TSTSLLLSAASFSAAQRTRSLRSSAMRAPVSRTIVVTSAALFAFAERLAARLRLERRAPPPTPEQHAASPVREACAAPHRPTRPRSVHFRRHDGPLEPTPDRTRSRIVQQSYSNITAAGVRVNSGTIAASRGHRVLRRFIEAVTGSVHFGRQASISAARAR